MPLQQPVVIATPIAPSGSSVTLPQAESIQVDQVGNVVISWANPTSDLRPTLDGLVSRGVAQYRNRSGYFLAVADPGARLIELAWQEWDPWAGVPRDRSARGALALQGHAVERDVERVNVVLYLARAIYERATGVVLE